MTSTKHTEEQPTARCSCRIIHAIMDEGIWYCALHGAAPELLAALQFLADKCNDPALVTIADAAITKATEAAK